MHRLRAGILPLGVLRPGVFPRRFGLLRLCPRLLLLLRLLPLGLSLGLLCGRLFRLLPGGRLLLLLWASARSGAISERQVRMAVVVLKMRRMSVSFGLARILGCKLTFLAGRSSRTSL
ncbi:hypothetical protein [Paracoccus sp. N5]|uniref:hypothetical protein n=1 Tax=Paracoccus sp. N5 TaxID=1101189 RepID=UPI00036C2283|nr:hypothetical protein [Paracoccus sp. N5]